MLRRQAGGAGVSIAIRKSIPLSAGLGGGSSDAAAVLVACNRLLGAGLEGRALAEIGAELGMDVPFFLLGPTAVASGRGEVLVEAPHPGPFWVLLVNPGFETSTAGVYNKVTLGLTKKVDCTTIARLRSGTLAAALHNDLETVTAAAHPEIADIRSALLEAGALGARMSGSGPTVYGLFETEAACRKAADGLAVRGWRLFPAEALTESPFAAHL